MITLRTTSASLLLLASLAMLAASRGNAVEHRCEIPNAQILGDDPQSATLACDGAKRATTFLRAQGLDVSADIRIRLIAQLANENAAGHLVASSREALVLNYAEFLKLGEWLRVPVNAEIYRALVAHEVAHVVAAHNFRIRRPRVEAHEYIAYVTAFATLDKAQRERVLDQFSGDGFDTEQQMNTTIYLCDPMRFGAEAYRHFVKKGRAADYFRLILSGRVLAG